MILGKSLIIDIKFLFISLITLIRGVLFPDDFGPYTKNIALGSDLGMPSALLSFLLYTRIFHYHHSYPNTSVNRKNFKILKALEGSSSSSLY